MLKSQVVNSVVRNYFPISLCLFACSCSVASISDSDQKAVLVSHNTVRAKHASPPLVWSNKLARYAASYASHCIFKHSGSPYGENLAAGYPSVSAAVKAWYDENQQYRYDHPGFSKATGHFTQVVWHTTQEVGCGYVACNGKNGTPGGYLVCEYSPAGNVVNEGYFDQNVLPPS